VTARGTTNRNSRGSVEDRRRRRQWLLDTFGDGTSAPCSLQLRCDGTALTLDTVTVDRFPVPGIEGGTYERGNIRPACGPCNSADGNALREARKTRPHRHLEATP
jgi:hypothetical protein